MKNRSCLISSYATLHRTDQNQKLWASKASSVPSTHTHNVSWFRSALNSSVLANWEISVWILHKYHDDPAQPPEISPSRAPWKMHFLNEVKNRRTLQRRGAPGALAGSQAYTGFDADWMCTEFHATCSSRFRGALLKAMCLSTAQLWPHTWWRITSVTCLGLKPDTNDARIYHSMFFNHKAPKILSHKHIHLF